MKKLWYLFSVICVIGIIGCSDEDLFEDVNYNPIGAAVNMIGGSPGFFDLGLDDPFVSFDVAATEMGEAISNVEISVSGPGGSGVLTNLSSLPATVTASLSEVAAALGISPDDVAIGDAFTFTARTTSSSGTFRSASSVTAPASCLSELAGVYDTQSTGWCGLDIPDGTVEIIELAAGVYTFSDWSFGVYETCYPGFFPTGWGELAFSDVCNKLTMVGIIDEYGEPWDVAITDVSGPNLSLSWSNPYTGPTGQEMGTVTIIRTDGSDWPPLSF